MIFFPDDWTKFFFFFVRSFVFFLFYFILFFDVEFVDEFSPIEIHRWGIVSCVLVVFSYQILRDHSRKELIIVIIKKNYRDFESVFGVNSLIFKLYFLISFSMFRGEKNCSNLSVPRSLFQIKQIIRRAIKFVSKILVSWYFSWCFIRTWSR